PSVPEAQEIQAKLHEIFRKVLGLDRGVVIKREQERPIFSGDVDLGSVNVKAHLVWSTGRQRFLVVTDLPSASWSTRVLRSIGRRLEAHGHLLKECPAPGVRAKAGETCGAWFVAGRPNQNYCSGTCQSRAATRNFRAGQQHQRKRRTG